jgi:trimethylamine--corrinoid protein Co-methyltransferase
MSEGRRTRSGGRAARQAARVASALEQQKFLTRTLAPLEVLSDEALSLIEHNADTLLEQVGIEVVGYDEAVRIFAAAGADVDGTRVRFPREMCRQIIQASAPKVFTQHARNPERSVVIGDPHLVFAPVYGPPFVRDLEGGRRYATLQDFHNLAKLTAMSPALHHGGGTLCEPVDVPVNQRHLDMLYAHVKYHDKPFMGSVTHPDRAQDSVDLAKVVFGADIVAEKTVMLALANANSPMSWDHNMLGSAKVYAENNQAVLITPFILAGAMSPSTVAATATQTLAEALAGMAFTQIVRPGAPVIFGSFASSMSMQSGAPTFGTPEPAMMLYVVAQLARRLGVPFRSGGNFTASKIADAQAAYESAMSFLPTVQAGVNFVLHAAGWLEGGLTVGYEKFIIDADEASMMERWVRGVAVDDNSLALDAMIENGPGQHFLGTAHTLANFETAFWRSELADNNSFEQWELEGSRDAMVRASEKCKQMLASYEPPPLAEALDAELIEWIARRKALLPDANP